MDQDDSLTRLQGLQADLVAFSESRLLNVDRLWTELEDSIADFRKLLDRQNKNDRSRQALKAGTLVKTRVVETMR
jgi:nuclear pore complex protein Nup205